MSDESYDSLPLLHKVEIFQYALDNTTGQDLYRILWLKSRNSDIWLERRTTYTRSLGLNSMVGYILGLGDRHPSNLLLDQITGKMVHIDFVRWRYDWLTGLVRLLTLLYRVIVSRLLNRETNTLRKYLSDLPECSFMPWR